jgi:hypothetical protein
LYVWNIFLKTDNNFDGLRFFLIVINFKTTTL